MMFVMRWRLFSASLAMACTLALAARPTPPTTHLHDALVLLQVHAKIFAKVDGRGASVSLTEEGYQSVANLKDDGEMKSFILRQIHSLNLEVREGLDDDLNGFTAWYSGTLAVQNLQNMSDELKRMSWLRPMPAAALDAKVAVPASPSLPSKHLPEVEPLAMLNLERTVSSSVTVTANTSANMLSINVAQGLARKHGKHIGSVAVVVAKELLELSAEKRDLLLDSLNDTKIVLQSAAGAVHLKTSRQVRASVEDGTLAEQTRKILEKREEGRARQTHIEKATIINIPSETLNDVINTSVPSQTLNDTVKATVINTSAPSQTLNDTVKATETNASVSSQTANATVTTTNMSLAANVSVAGQIVSDVSVIAAERVQDAKRKVGGQKLSDALKAATSKVVHGVFGGWFKSSDDKEAAASPAAAPAKHHKDDKKADASPAAAPAKDQEEANASAEEQVEKSKKSSERKTIAKHKVSKVVTKKAPRNTSKVANKTVKLSKKQLRRLKKKEAHEKAHHKKEAKGKAKALHLSRAGYQEVAKSNDTDLAVAFIQRLSKWQGLRITSNESLVQVARFYGGECGAGSYPALMAELDSAAEPSACGKIWAERDGKSAVGEHDVEQARVDRWAGRQERIPSWRWQSASKPTLSLLAEAANHKVSETRQRTFGNSLAQMISTTLGQSAELSTDGYNAVLKLERPGDMELFVRRAVAGEGLRVRDDNVLQSLLPYYDGTCDSQTYESLIADLRGSLSRSESCGGQWLQRAF